MMRPTLLVVAVLGACALTMTSEREARAQFDLQITEIWPGNDPGNNLTQDWFEITNVGDAAWTAAVHGNLYWEDVSADPSIAELISGIASIAASESVVVVNGQAAGAAAWSTLWDDVVILPQVGHSDGPGLGQGGDTVNLYLDDMMVGPPTLSLLSSAAFPDANSNGGQSWDVALGAFSTVGNSSGAVATLVLNDAMQPAIGSPGSVVPEPASSVLMLAGVVIAALCRRRAG